ncbi:hypothetical protein J5N97_015680 [Dioscorea zingiberensis]|uniref:Uncharacterized protein n=1 Tax=Dioscorea zingiberensis TaxID=325984 RepID=A0A9D5CIL0_9LILI|nr:hypothetical protein J5N97_015680 [Dioscorea zingiberensis]
MTLPCKLVYHCGCVKMAKHKQGLPGHGAEKCSLGLSEKPTGASSSDPGPTVSKGKGVIGEEAGILQRGTETMMEVDRGEQMERKMEKSTIYGKWMKVRQYSGRRRYTVAGDPPQAGEEESKVITSIAHEELMPCDRLVDETVEEHVEKDYPLEGDTSVVPPAVINLNRGSRVGQRGRGRGDRHAGRGRANTMSETELVEPTHQGVMVQSQMGRGSSHKKQMRASRSDLTQESGAPLQELVQHSCSPGTEVELLSSVIPDNHRSKLRASCLGAKRGSSILKENLSKQNHQALVLCVSGNIPIPKDQEQREMEFMDAEEPPDPGEERIGSPVLRDEESFPLDPGESMQVERPETVLSDCTSSKRSTVADSHIQKKGRIDGEDEGLPTYQFSQ